MPAPGPLTLRPLAAEDDPARQAVQDTSPDATLFQSLEFRRVLDEVVPGTSKALGAFRRDTLQGFLPWKELTVPGVGTLVNSLPWYGSHGGAVLAAGAGDEVRDALLAGFGEHLAATPDLLSATVSLSPFEAGRAEEYRARLGARTRDHRIGQVTPLPSAGADPEAALLSGFEKKTRNLVRKACRQGFRLEDGDHDRGWAVLAGIHEQNMAALGGKAKPRHHFEALRRHLPRRRLALALDGDTPVAGLLVFYFRDQAEYFTPVVHHDWRPRQPLSFLILEVMKEAMARGIRIWNWGGTWPGQASLHHFKAGFGAEDRPYSYEIVAPDPGLERLRQHRTRLGELFPWYYAYPYAEL